MCGNIVISFQIKAMAEHLDQTDRLCAPRQMRFSDHFIDDVSSLIGNLIKDIVERYIKVININAFIEFIQPVFHYTSGITKAGICYPVSGMVHIKDPLLLLRMSSPCSSGSG